MSDRGPQDLPTCFLFKNPGWRIEYKKYDDGTLEEAYEYETYGQANVSKSG